jgi:esterase/lipase superfamily enzyme
MFGSEEGLVHARQPIALLAYLLVALMSFAGVAYGEAAQGASSGQQVAQTAANKPKPTQADIDRLNRRIGALRRSGKSAAAIPLAQRAVRLTEARYGRNHLRTASALTALADLMIANKRYASAEPLLQRALAIQKRAKSTPGALARTYRMLGTVAEKRGRKADAARYRKLADGWTAAGRETQEKSRIQAQQRAEKKETAKKKSFKYAPPTSRSLEAKRMPGPDGGTGQSGRGVSGGAPTVGAPPTIERRAARPPTTERRAYRRAERPASPDTSRGIAPSAPGGGTMAGAPAPGAEGPAPSVARAPAASEDAVEAAEDAGEAFGPETAWDVVPVFYGTDRAEKPAEKRVAYSSDRARRLALGRALVTVPKIHEVPQVERPWAIRIPYFDVTIWEEEEDPNKHFTMQEIKKLTKEKFLELVKARLGGSKRFKDHALVFVHGYNTSFDNAVYRTAQIAYDLKFDGAPFLYSWPSGGAVASYTWDRASAEASKRYMREFLEMVVRQTGAKSVSIIAHSMGNMPLMSVLKDMKSTAPDDVVISQVILAAPDVDLDAFVDLADSIKGMARGITLYAAANDRALQASRNFWGYYRAGDVPASGPLVVPGVDTIDVTAASTDTFSINHSGYAEKNTLLQDIRELIQTGLRPPDQRELHPERMATDKGAYWRYVGR